MPIVKAIHIAPVKSLSLLGAETVRVGVRGIAEDRRFLVRDGSGVMVTQRQLGMLALVKARYCAESDALEMEFPDGRLVSGAAELGDGLETRVFRRVVSGRVVLGGWSDALSAFCGEELTLVKSDGVGDCFDEYPISILSEASVERLGDMAQGEGVVGYRRFRPNLLLGGCSAHEEDTWVGRELVVGEGLRLRVEALDPRCAITTLNPDTGKRDVDTLRMIRGYRSGVGVRGAYFGVYGSVEAPGSVSVGDELRVAG